MHIPRGSFDAYAGLIFDCDGTLVDTMPAHFVAWTATASKYGLTFPEDRFYEWGGVPAPTIVRTLADEQGVSLDADAVADEKERLYTESLDSLQPVHAIVEVARRHRGKMPMAVATGAHQWVAGHSLSIVGIADWFDCVVTFEDVARPKPAPDTYLEAARRLGLPPGDCLAFEDTDLGMQSARDAGMDVIDVRPHYRRA